VGTEEWRGKWREQLRQMQQVEAGRSSMNVRRRRVVKQTAATAPSSSASGSDAGATATDDAASTRWSPGSATMDERERTWQRDQEMQWAVRSQLGTLKDRTRRRRQVAPPQKSKFVEPFVDDGSSVDDWNHSVQ
jgi:hypothetical protein